MNERQRHGSPVGDEATIDYETDRYEIVTAADALKSLQPEWDELHTRSIERRFSQSYAWCWTTWEVVEQPQGHRLHCLVARNRGRVVLIWPFAISRAYLSTDARPLGNSYGEYANVLVEDDPDAHRRICEAWQILCASCRCSVVILPNVRRGSELHSLLLGEKAATVAEILPTLSVSWDGFRNWEAYFGQLKRGDRQDLRRTRRRFEELGELTFEPVDDRARCEVLIDWAIGHKIEQLSATKRRAPWLETREYRSLLVTAVSRAGPAGRLVIFTLKLRDQLLAVLVTRVDTLRVETLITVYDSAYRKYGPGQLLWESCLKWACERRLEFDMRPGDFQYKREWANRESDVITYEVANSFWAAIYFAARRAYRLRLLIPQSWQKSIKAVLRRARP